MINLSNRQFNDKLMFEDSVSGARASGKGLWAKTEVLMGYGDIHETPSGKSTLGEVIFAGSNMVTIGGVQYAMEKIFGVNGDNLNVLSKTLYKTTPCTALNNAEELNIGLPNTDRPNNLAEPEDWRTYLNDKSITFSSDEAYKNFIKYIGEVYQVPRDDRNPNAIGNMPYRNGHRVQLFGVGTSGITDNDVTVYSVDYKDTGIEMIRSYDGQTDIKGHMLPFRQTADTLNADDRLKYFGKKIDKVGGSEFTSYYLKKFEAEPEIKHVWASGTEADAFEDIENQESAKQEDIWNDNGTKTNTLESFTEMRLKISSKDLKEYYSHLEHEDQARFNTIALFAGRYVRDDKDPTDYGDFEDVIMFSKLILPVEYVSMNKDLNIIYRVYGS